MGDMQTMTEQKKRYTILGIFVAMFLFGAFFLRETGVYFDEHSEEEILYMNILQYGETLQISKITNWFQWKDGYRPICESIERDHGSAPYYLCVPLLMKLEQHPEAARLQSDVWHAYTYALFFLGVIYMYRLLWELFQDRRTALLGTLMLFLTPRIFADGLYNNKDSVLMSLIIVMLFYGIRFLERKDFKNACLLGICAGFCGNLKISGIYVFAMIGGFYLLILTKEKKWSGKTFFVGFAATVVGFLSYLALTPAIWGQGFHLWEFLLWNLSNSTNFSRMDGKVLFDGTWYVHSTNPLPWYYLPKLIALTIPVYLSVLLWSSIGIWIYKGRKHQWDFADRIYPLFALTSGIPVLAAMLCDPNLYNGWRHMYFIYGPMIVMMAYAVRYLLQQPGIRARRIATAMLVVLIGCNGVGIALTGQSSSAYTNILAGGDACGRYEMDYYGVTAKKVLKSLVDRYGEICIRSDGCGATIVNYYVLPAEYREKIRLVSSQEEIQAAVDQGKLVLGCVNPSYDILPEGEDVVWLEDWKAWGNTYMKIRKY